MVFIHKYYEQYNYHYENEYPIHMFIKNKFGKKNAKISKIEKNIYEDKPENNNTGESIKCFEKLTLNYYNNYKLNNIYCENNNNSLYKNIDLINVKKNNIHKYHAEIIYTYYHIYDDFLKNQKYNGSSILYKDFKIFIKENKIIEIINNSGIKINVFYKYSEKSYNLINFIDEKNPNKEKIINLIMMLELNIEKLYKLNKTCMSLLINFIKDKYQKICITNNKITYNNIKGKHNITDINKLCRDIPITYIGSKRKIADKVLNHLSLYINNNTKTYIELFAGSLCMSYLVKNLYPNINIVAYENDKFLINFYNVLKNNYNEFISKLTNMINKLKKSNNQYNYLKEIINIINKKLCVNVIKQNDIDLACYYYIINKLSFRGTLNYNSENLINITINNQRINMLTKFNERHKNKLYKYSLFLNKIKLINMDISNNYDKILNSANDDTIIYIDPPYYKEKYNHKPYQNMFDKHKHIELKVFLDKLFKKGCKWIKNNSFNGYIMELFEKYNKTIINIRNDICNSLRSDLLISSF